jgi:hypothetical protein
VRERERDGGKEGKKKMEAKTERKRTLLRTFALEEKETELSSEYRKD